MSIYRKCQIPAWKERALKFAHSLEGRENTATENEFIATHPDPWDFFYIFGADESRQAYINATIRQIEKCNNIGDQVVCECRLSWSAQRLLKGKTNYEARYHTRPL